MNEKAQIRIKNLRLRTYIGFNEEERKNKQDVVINILLEYPATKACQTDDVADAVNYRTICKQVISHVEDNRFLLLEKLTQDIMDICFSNPHISFAQVEVDKPHALRFADSVSFCLSRNND